MPGGQPIDAYVLSTPRIKARILTLGGIISHLYTPDRTGKAADIVLGFDQANDYLGVHPYFGAIIGRVGNRIARGTFALDGVTYRLATNDGPNHLHGGRVGYDKRLWKATVLSSAETPSLQLTLQDPDGYEGYPGNLDVTVVYTLQGQTLRITYSATTDRATPINLTNHSYFNLKDGGASTHYDHVLQLNTTHYNPTDETMIPTGEVRSVADTTFDFTKPKPIGHNLSAGIRFDNNFVLRDGPGPLAQVARVVEPVTGRTMECWTTEPGVQFYSGNFLDGSNVGKGGVPYQRHTGFCLETQHAPDSINQPQFPSTVLRPGRTYQSTTEYRFGAE